MLKTDRALVQFRLVSGSRQVADASLPPAEPRVLQIPKRMKLEWAQLDGVARKMEVSRGCCCFSSRTALQSEPVGLVASSVAVK